MPKMSVKTHHVAVSLIIGALVLGGLAWTGLRAPTALATCSTGANISLLAPPANTTLSGTTTLTASTSGSSSQPQAVTFMITAPSQIALGDVSSPSGSGGAIWSFSWDSRSVPDGGYQFAAVAHYGTNTTYDCLSAPVPAQVLNSTAGGKSPTLAASISPGSWEGTPGQQQQFSVTGVYTDALGQQHSVTPAAGATYQWGTNAGQLSAPNGPAVTLTDGPTTGSFMIGVSINMDGLNITKQVQVKIVASGTTSGSSPGGPSPSPSPSPQSGSDDTAPLTPQQITMLQTTPTIFRPSAPTNADPIVPVQTLGCLLQKLGTQFDTISSGASQPTLSDKLAGAECFSGSTKIPSSLAPVAPASITNLPTTGNVVTLDSAKNETITSKSGSKVTAILLSGTGTPTANIFLYIFSDPMVLRAQTDSQGKWTYVLENPLKPGHHEFYAVSQQDSANFVRTPALPVTIAAAAQGNQDGSLVIEHALQPVQIGYIIGSALMVVIGLFLLLRLTLRRRTAPLQSAPSLVVPAAPAPPGSTPAPAPDDNSDHANPV